MGAVDAELPGKLLTKGNERPPSGRTGQERFADAAVDEESKISKEGEDRRGERGGERAAQSASSPGQHADE